ncbi:hypothetical protein CC85DRAFT_27064 [Cutaneotrichosporon oleaginosum]|uniref:Uncharacterized protein n=1 Tax=Cutaneotrichosporon oleaginosum TaxID=879819 RepID=A0A0J1AT92_9TREE|nr:uncharacterized protein CC85DRAFT_27064 [Cutaneotrichosporon oleaginosum]KLT38539.1 hypothetical protein CC85DRAFT_27064 [Cutaneotrichosporon oleaginosum]TXT08586.1 hypothetical protein COLE_05510 [Cutaneotrichosporon oleaginosum]
MALIDLIPGFNMVCFPTCMASLASTATLIAFIFDLAIFFIAKGAIGKMSGANAQIGAAVWMTLAAWVCCSVAICAFGMANCCCSCGGSRREERKKKKNRDNDDEFDSYRRDHDMRLHAIRDEERRKYEQDLPSFQPFEREPLNPGPPEDKYLYDAPPVETGTGVHGVGVGYGRRNGTPNPYAQAAAPPTSYGQTLGVRRQPSTGSSMLTAGNAGVGAGGEGVDQPRNEYGYAGQREQIADNCELARPGWNALSPRSPLSAADTRLRSVCRGPCPAIRAGTIRAAIIRAAAVRAAKLRLQPGADIPARRSGRHDLSYAPARTQRLF